MCVFYILFSTMPPLYFHSISRVFCSIFYWFLCLVGVFVSYLFCRYKALIMLGIDSWSEICKLEGHKLLKGHFCADQVSYPGGFPHTRPGEPLIPGWVSTYPTGFALDTQKNLKTLFGRKSCHTHPAGFPHTRPGEPLIPGWVSTYPAGFTPGLRKFLTFEIQLCFAPARVST